MPWNSSIAVFSISPTTAPNEMSPASSMPALTIASIATSAAANPLFMLLAPRPKTQPSRQIALGLKPSPARCSSSPE